MAIKLIGTVILGVGIAFAANADEGKKKQSRAEKRMASVEEKYEPTGQTKRCVPLRSLRDSRIIDDQTIFFRAGGGKAYLNRLPRRCPRLASEERFSYRVSIGQLCNTEIITVLDSMGSSWGSCGLGDFEVWQKKSKAESAPTD